MAKKLEPGQNFPKLDFKNIHGGQVSIPAPGVWTHVQFRRFAGCPICNLHLQSFVGRNDEILAAGVREVVFFHSTEADLLPYQGNFKFDVIGDPEKKFYKQFGIETSILAILNPMAWPAMFKGSRRKGKPSGHPGQHGPLGLPADFLIAEDGKLREIHYGKHAYDQWSVDELLELVHKHSAPRPSYHL